jgi:hypothetical protein
MARLSLERETLRRTNAIRTLRAIGPLALLAAMTASCFITSTPDFQPKPQTPPSLLSQGADPPVGDIVLIEQMDFATFSANVRSQDTDSVKFELLVDYGFKHIVQGPTGEIDSPFAVNVDSGSIGISTENDTSRVAQGTWIRGNPFNFTRHCHRFTLIVSHAFAPDGCPVDLNDSSFLSWNVVDCPNNTCPPIDPTQDCAPPIIGEAGKPFYCPASSNGGA